MTFYWLKYLRFSKSFWKLGYSTHCLQHQLLTNIWSIHRDKNKKRVSILTLFQARQGQFDPQHHTYVCSFYSNRARLTKIGDFVSLTIWLVPKKPFLKFLLQNFWKIWILNFWGSSSISRKLKILTKKIIFLQRLSFFLAESILYMFSAFFWGI